MTPLRPRGGTKGPNTGTTRPMTLRVCDRLTGPQGYVQGKVMRRWPPRRTAVLLALVGLLAFLPGQQASQSATAAPRTIVSLTFDDGHLSHRSTLSMLASRGMVGTYYINSAMVGSSW